MGPGCRGNAARTLGLLCGILEAERPVRCPGGGLPAVYSSPNAPAKRDVLGTAVLSILAGHWRYAHITALRGDTVNPPLLGMTRVVSEDAVRRGLDKIEVEAGAR